MSNGITFTNYKEAIEYAHQKENEGIRTAIYKENRKYAVYLTGKLARIDKKQMAMTAGIPVPYKDTDTVSMIYDKIRREKFPLKRSAQDIKAITKDRFAKSNLKDIEVYVSDKLSLQRIAAANYPKKKGEKFQIIFHPINKYTSDKYFEYILQHEIEHIKEHSK